LNDVFVSCLTVHGFYWQAKKMDEQLLRPVLYVLFRCPSACMSADPLADVIGKSLVELIEVLRNHKPVVPNVTTVSDLKGITVARRLFHRNIAEFVCPNTDFNSIGSHEGISFGKDLNHMRASIRGRDELTVRVQTALSLPTKKEAEMVADAVIAALEATLLNNLGTDGFTLKLNGFGKFSVRHKAGILRRIPFTGETIQTKMRRKIRFISLGMLREQERVS
jgi:nucleoid DNA-binding protein